MKYIDEVQTNEIVILKSKFIASIYPVSSIEDVNTILSSTRKKYYDASHNCYAYILGDNMEIQKASDDGEPQKTAGFPMLDVLKKNEITNVLCIVTRYFGGTLLGAGGLIRAYSESVSEVLKKVRLSIKKALSSIIIKLDYSSYNNLISNITNIKIIDTSFDSLVTLKIAFDENNYDEIIKSINNLSKGKALIENSESIVTFIPID